MCIKKQYVKNKPICKVTFCLQKEVALSAKSVKIVGEFNDWSIKATPMKGLKNGEFKVTLDLDVDKEYQFRYLIDDTRWENDGNADKYVQSPYGECENSVVVV
jgi:1,4-alpha-glucan branching enzyme